MNQLEYCPNCSIGLGNQEIRMRFCQNCKHHWDEDDENLYDDIEFVCCGKCDLPDACADFGCAIEQGIKK